MKSATSISVLQVYNCLKRSVPETCWDWLALCHEICNFYLSVAGVQLSEQISPWDTLGLVGLVSWNLQLLSQCCRCTTVWRDQYLRHARTGWPCVMKSATSISVLQVYNCLNRSVPETRWHWLALCHEICNFCLSVAGVQLSEEISPWDTLECFQPWCTN